MFLERLIRPGPAKTAGRRLYAAMVAQAREPALYETYGAPDTPDGRFEIYTLHVLLVVQRLKGQGARAAAVSQAFFDDYLSGLDHGLRELAVGDLAVGRSMRKLGGAFYGRAKAMETALAALPDRAPLEALVIRTVFDGVEAAKPAELVDYLLRQREILAAASLEGLLDGDMPSPAAE